MTNEVQQYNEDTAINDVVAASRPAELVNAESFISTLTATDPATKVRILSALNNAEPLAAYEGVVIELAGIVARPAQYRDQQGTVRTGTGVYVLGKDGRSYFSLAGGVFDAFRDLIGMFEADSSQWPAGLAIIPKRRQLAGGKQLQSFDVLIVDQPQSK